MNGWAIAVGVQIVLFIINTAMVVGIYENTRIMAEREKGNKTD